MEVDQPTVSSKPLEYGVDAVVLAFEVLEGLTPGGWKRLLCTSPSVLGRALEIIYYNPHETGNLPHPSQKSMSESVRVSMKRERKHYSARSSSPGEAERRLTCC